ncbi:efflux RND transporter periplasmic adaptor subunit [Leptolyngbya ohadii]|uniref:efflux RND transporter periplasmic adaptor subunit n=1 Tax=Leptolyngbya ohadii TaxID=1962290 RepID=UPI000B5A0619|nr:efflux RND transporter periplasmic adaptor subunit [Leptolyngbya ohadii]
MLPPNPRALPLRFLFATIVPFAALGLLTGCGVSQRADAQSQAPQGRPANAPASVETAVAEAGSLQDAIAYTGTTQPANEVPLRSQAEGRLLDLAVNVGDSVGRGQPLGQVDDRLLLAQVNQERANLASLQSEVAQAEAEVSDARTQVEQARVQLQQAQADANRLESLAREGAITVQAAEQARTQAATAQQALRSAQEQVRTRLRAVQAAQGRVAAQQATLAEVQERRSFSVLTSPITGTVVRRAVEPGDVVQPGSEVVRLGDFSQVKVVVQVSELERGRIRVGQTANVQLDAFPDQQFQGEVIRISPAADPTARQIPVEIVIPNPNRAIGSGLLARVQFPNGGGDRVIIPESALSVSGEGAEQASAGSQVTLFVIEGEGQDVKVVARPAEIGNRENGRVEVRSGLRAGEAFVVRSSQPLKEGQPVKLSILSETETQRGQAQ